MNWCLLFVTKRAQRELLLANEKKQNKTNASVDLNNFFAPRV